MKTCLVVDDSAAVRTVARRVLESMQFNVIEAEDGAQALDKCSEKLPEVVLLDWDMRNKDAIEFLRMLRKIPGGESPKVVFSTVENSVSQIARALHAGADEYILKPFDKEILQRKFHQAGLV